MLIFVLKVQLALIIYFTQAVSSVMERNIAHRITQLCKMYRFLLSRFKAQINQCLEYAGRNPRAKIAISFSIVGIFLLWLRKLGQSGARLFLAVRCEALSQKRKSRSDPQLGVLFLDYPSCSS
jgi:hypothetical protein